jgi:hypothetical protein
MPSLIAGDPFCDFFSHHIVASFAGYGITAKPGFLKQRPPHAIILSKRAQQPSFIIRQKLEIALRTARLALPASNRSVKRIHRTTGCTETMLKRKQLRYTFAAKSRRWDLNPQPPLYESGALPLSYAGIIANFPDS